VAYSHYERLSAMDMSFLAMEDGRAHMHIASVAIFEAGPLRGPDGGLDFERIFAFIDARLHRIPRLRQRLAWVPGIGQPVWVDDADFNLRFHVRHTALPAPGDVRQLKRLAGRVLSQEFDRGKPLWEDWFVDGLEGDRFALISKVHHCMADGIAGLAIANMLVGPDSNYENGPGPQWIPRPAPGGSELLVDELWHRVKAPLSLLTSALRGRGGGTAGALPSVAGLRDIVGGGLGGSTTPLNVSIGPHRRFDWTRTSFDEVHEIGSSAGGTVNDVVLAVVAGALRPFLRRRGLSVDGLDLRVMIPVSVRADGDGEALGNRVSSLFVPLPLAERDPWKRLVRIVETTRDLKASGQSGAGDALGQLADLVPPWLLGPFFRRGSRATPANLVVTNVPGIRMPLYLLGARQLETYPVVPLISNQALGIALLSYDDGLFWGFNADWDVVPDLHELVEHVDVAFEELRDASRAREGAGSAGA